MTMKKLRDNADALHSLAPEGIHVPHWHGTKADRDKFAAEIQAEKNPFMKKAMREVHARFLVIDDKDAAKHAAVVARLPDAAERLVDALGLRGPGVHPVPAQEGNPEVIGGIAEADAKRYLVKCFRELRQKVGNKAPVDVVALAEKVAEHLGVKGGDVASIAEELALELSAFTAEHDAAKEAIGGHAQCHEDLGFIDARLQTP